MPVAQIVALEYAVSGTTIMYAGIVPRVLSSICTQTVLYYVFAFQPFVRLMRVTHATSRVRRLHRLTKRAMRFG